MFIIVVWELSRPPTQRDLWFPAHFWEIWQRPFCQHFPRRLECFVLVVLTKWPFFNSIKGVLIILGEDVVSSLWKHRLISYVKVLSKFQFSSFTSWKFSEQNWSWNDGTNAAVATRKCVGQTTHWPLSWSSRQESDKPRFSCSKCSKQYWSWTQGKNTGATTMFVGKRTHWRYSWSNRQEKDTR